MNIHYESETRHALITLRLEMFQAAQILNGSNLDDLETMALDLINFIKEKRKKK